MSKGLVARKRKYKKIGEKERLDIKRGKLHKKKLGLFPNIWRLTWNERSLDRVKERNYYPLCGYMRRPCWKDGVRNSGQIYGLCSLAEAICHSPFPMKPIEKCDIYTRFLDGRQVELNYFHFDKTPYIDWEFSWRGRKVVSKIYLEQKGNQIKPRIEIEGYYCRNKICPLDTPRRIKKEYLHKPEGESDLRMQLYGVLSAPDYEALAINLRGRSNVRVRQNL